MRSSEARQPRRHAPRGPVKGSADPMPNPDPMAGKCTAKSKTSGKRCAQPAIPGGRVCRYHGGAAPQVKQAAMARLLALQHPAIDRLTKLIDQDAFPTVAYAAARDVLDRTMGKPHESVTVSGDEDNPLVMVLSRLKAGRDRIAAAKRG